MARFWAQLYVSVDSAFRAHPSDSSARVAARDTVYRRARQQLIAEWGPQLKTYSTRGLERMRLDNAALLARRIYSTDLDAFDMVWASQRGDLRATVLRIIELAKTRPKDPFGALRGSIPAQ
jgi:hypothetical protein